MLFARSSDRCEWVTLFLLILSIPSLVVNVDDCKKIGNSLALSVFIFFCGFQGI